MVVLVCSNASPSPFSPYLPTHIRPLLTCVHLLATLLCMCAYMILPSEKYPWCTALHQLLCPQQPRPPLLFPSQPHQPIRFAPFVALSSLSHHLHLSTYLFFTVFKTEEIFFFGRVRGVILVILFNRHFIHRVKQFSDQQLFVV